MDSDEKYKPIERCPALGFKGDPNTSIGEPSSWNYCHKVDPIAIPNYAQQSAKCLSSAYPECPLFQAKESPEMPEDLRYQQKVPFWKKYSKYLGALGILLIFAIVWWALRNFQNAQGTLSPEERQMTNEAQMLLTLIAQPTETLSSVPSSPTPTKTVITATQTRTPFPTRTPKTPTYAPVKPSNTPYRLPGGNDPAPTSAPPTSAPPTSVPPTQPPAPTATDPVRPTP
jgi:cytoskeletal protein RodZ